MDSEVYGNDICAGEVDVFDANRDAADDLRACLSFLRRDHSIDTIAKMLMANGTPASGCYTARFNCRSCDERGSEVTPR